MVAMSLLIIAKLFMHLTLAMDADCSGTTFTCADFTTAEKQAILDLHNELRDRVAGGGMSSEGHPAAKDMNYLIWDEGLQSVAQTHAETCPQGDNPHNPSRNVEIKDERDGNGTKWGTANGNTLSATNGPCASQNEACIAIGENIARQNPTAYDLDTILSQIETGWWDEYRDWEYGASNTGCSDVCGHYTQMAWANTRYIGCGYANGCGGAWSSVFVCNYFPTGNMNGAVPYEEATAATRCTNCMSDRTVCKSVYQTRSNTASSYLHQPYNALCGGGACPTMCAGDSYNRATCDECTPSPSNQDCDDGTIALDDGRDICTWTNAPTSITTAPTSAPTDSPTEATSNPTTAAPTPPTTAPTPAPTSACVTLSDLPESAFDGSWYKAGVQDGESYYTKVVTVDGSDANVYLYSLWGSYWCIGLNLGQPSMYAYCAGTPLLECTDSSWTGSFSGTVSSGCSSSLKTNDVDEWTDVNQFGAKQYIVFSVMGLMVIGCVVGAICGAKYYKKRKARASRARENDVAAVLQMQGPERVTVSTGNKLATDVSTDGDNKYTSKFLKERESKRSNNANPPTMQMLGHGAVPSVSFNTPAEPEVAASALR